MKKAKHVLGKKSSWVIPIVWLSIRWQRRRAAEKESEGTVFATPPWVTEEPAGQPVDETEVPTQAEPVEESAE